MIELLLKRFARNGGDGWNEHAAIGRLAGIVGVACNALLCAGKLIAGVMTGSVSIAADALNSLTDAASSLITTLGFRMAQRPADREHPFGHARFEYLSGLAVALLILAIGLNTARSAVERILHPEPLALSGVAIAIMVGSVGVKLWMSAFFRKMGNAIRSTALRATAADSRNDAIGTAGVLAGCAVEALSGARVDGWIGLIVAAIILYSGFCVARETVTPILGKQPDADVVKRLHEIVLSHEHVLGIHDLLVHDYGPGRCYASVHAEMSAAMDPLACHAVADDIEQAVRGELNIELVVHCDPVAVEDAEWRGMRVTVEEIVRGIDADFSVHDLRISHEQEMPVLAFDLTVPYDTRSREAEIRASVEEALAAQGKRYAVEMRFDSE